MVKILLFALFNISNDEQGVVTAYATEPGARCYGIEENDHDGFISLMMLTVW